MKGCNWLRMREHERLVLRAFVQAMNDLGIPEHPDGQCPGPDCDCEARADEVEARAIQIIEAKLGRPLPPAEPDLTAQGARETGD